MLTYAIQISPMHIGAPFVNQVISHRVRLLVPESAMLFAEQDTSEINKTPHLNYQHNYL